MGRWPSDRLVQDRWGPAYVPLTASSRVRTFAIVTRDHVHDTTQRRHSEDLEKCSVLRVKRASPPLCLCPRCARRDNFVTASETAWKSHPLRIISSDQNCALTWCLQSIIKLLRDGKTSRSWIHFHFSGVIPRILRVRPWRGRVGGEERSGCFCSFSTPFSYMVILGHRNHVFDPASVFLSKRYLYSQQKRPKEQETGQIQTAISICKFLCPGMTLYYQPFYVLRWPVCLVGKFE